MIHLYLLRHGETEENVAGILQGQMPGKLTDQGKAQAVALQKVIARYPNLRYILSSDLQRAVDTANLINQPFHLPLRTTPLLRERDWGELTGVAIASLRKGPFPASVETVEEMIDRATTWLDALSREHLGEDIDILVVTHGLFARCILAAAAQTGIQAVGRLQNCEMREVFLQNDHPFRETLTQAENPKEKTVANPMTAGDVLTNGQEN